MGEKKTWETGGICPACNEGRIALCTGEISMVEKDQEPYESGKMEGNCEQIPIVDGLQFTTYVCDNCFRPFSADCQTDLSEFNDETNNGR